MKKLLRLVGSVAVAATAAGLLTVPAQAAGPAVTVRPDSPGRGAEVVGAHLATPGPDSRTIIDGDVRVRVRGDYVGLLGKRRNTYVVNVERQGVVSTLVVGRGGSERVLARDVEPEWVHLASDGSLLTIVRPGRGRSAAVEAIDVRDGETRGRHTFARTPRVLDVLDGRAILGADRLGTLAWDVAQDQVTRITRRFGYAADLEAGRLATFDQDPYDGGCTVVTTLARPRVPLWTSCEEKVRAFSRDGRRVATVDILSDGPGPDEVHARSVRGTLVASYAVERRFGAVRFETTRSLVLAAYGATKAAWVRCTAGTCERASAVSTTPTD